MKISNDFHHQQRESDDLRLVAKEELLSTLIGETVEDKLRRPIKERKGKKQQTTQKRTDSIGLINREADIKDLINNVAKKFAQKGVKVSQEWLKENIENMTQREIDNLYQKDTAKSIQDSVRVSQVKSPDSNQDRKKREINNTTQVSHDDAVDESPSVVKTSLKTQKDVQKNLKKQKTQHVQQRQVTQRKTPQEALKHYASLFSEAIINNKPEKKREAQLLSEQLLDEGVSTKKLKRLEGTIQSMVKKDLKQKLRKSFVDLALSYSKEMTPDLLANSEKFKQAKQLAEQGQALVDDPDFKEVKEGAKEDLRSFISSELDSTMIESKVRGDSIQEMIEIFNKFNDLVGITKFDTQSYMKNFQEKLDHLGLIYFEGPEEIGVIDTDGRSGSQSRDQKDEKEQREIESLEEEIRTLYMLKAVKRDFKSQVEITLKIRKFKKGLEKTKGYEKEQLALLKKEGEALAVLRLVEIVTECFEERATLPVLRGPAYNIVRNKLKYALKGLKRLGQPINKKELIKKRDRINKTVFSIVKEEYIKNEIMLEKFPANLKFIKQKKDYFAILERLRIETSISEDLKPKMFSSHGFKSEKTIMEAA